MRRAFCVFPVLDDQGALVGFSRNRIFSNRIARSQLILVDRDELGQAVRGADAVCQSWKFSIITSLAASRARRRSFFRNNPVWLDGRVVAMCYEQAGVGDFPGIAGLLMAGLIADTLHLTSPTTTPGRSHNPRGAREDRRRRPCGTGLGDLFRGIAGFLTMTPEQAIAATRNFMRKTGTASPWRRLRN